MFGIPLTHRDSIVLYHGIHNAEDLARCSEQIKKINEKLTRRDKGYVNRGTLVYTVPEAIRYRNDSTYLWDGQKLVALISSNLDDYGMTPPELVTLPGDPINIFMAPTHNGYWWPSQKLRQAVIDAPVITVRDAVSYRDIESHGTTFRFMCDETSNLENGAFSYDKAWYSSQETVYIGDDPEDTDSILSLPLPNNMVLCSVHRPLEPNFEICYDDWETAISS